MTAVDRIDVAGLRLAEARARRDSLSPEDAARAAGARTPEQVSALAARISADRQERVRSSA